MSYIQIIPEEIYPEKREGWHSISHIEPQTSRPRRWLQASQVHIVRPVKKSDNKKRENELTYSKHLLFLDVSFILKSRLRHYDFHWHPMP